MSLSTALRAVEANTDPAWKAEAEKVIRSLARRRSEFTTDEVWDAIEAKGFDTPEHRAMGPVMVRASKAGIVQRTRTYVLSDREECHRREKPIYKSLIFKG